MEIFWLLGIEKGSDKLKCVNLIRVCQILLLALVTISSCKDFNNHDKMVTELDYSTIMFDAKRVSYEDLNSMLHLLQQNELFEQQCYS